MDDRKNNCPTPEELQEFAWEERKDLRISQHLEHCPECRKTVEALQKLDSILEEYMMPPEGLSQNVLEACAAAKAEDQFLDSPAPRRSSRRSALWLSAAAALFLCCIAALLTRNPPPAELPAPEDPRQDSVDAEFLADKVPSSYGEEAVICDVQCAASEAPSPTFAPVEKASPVLARKALGSGAFVDERLGNPADGFSLRDSRALSRGRDFPQEVTTVSTGINGMGLHGYRNNQNVVPNEVNHVWLAKNLPSQEAFQAFFQKNNIQLEASDTDTNGVLTFTFTEADAKLQQLADLLYVKKNWRLLSPDAPQPCQQNRTILNGHPVKYTMQVVPAE